LTPNTSCHAGIKRKFVSLEEDWVQWGPVQKVKEVIILRAYILKKIGLNFCTLVALSAPLLALGANKEVQVIAGSGTATATSQAFFTVFSETEEGKKYDFKVPEKSNGTSGGLENSKNFIFGRAGRALKEQEIKDGYRLLVMGKNPITFVRGSGVKVNQITSSQLCDVYTGKITSWKALGGPDEKLVVFTRDPDEALLISLQTDLPCFLNQLKTPFVYKKDNEMINGITKAEHGKFAIGYGTVDMFDPSIHLKVSDKEFSTLIGLIYRVNNENHPLVVAAKKFTSDPRWTAKLRSMGLRPSDGK
jgi:hypothetical protein